MPASPTFAVRAAPALITLLLAACGGGGGSDAPTATADAGTPGLATGVVVDPAPLPAGGTDPALAGQAVPTDAATGALATSPALAAGAGAPAPAGGAGPVPGAAPGVAGTATPTPPAAAPGASPPAAPAPPTSTPAPAASGVARFLALDLTSLFDYAPRLPPHYAGTEAQDNTPAANALQPAVATLGRVLFHDKQLSVSRTVSCASCHDQARDLGDATRFSTGFDGRLTTAHSMRLANLRFFQAATMFWDRRAPTLEAQATLPVQHPVEMGFDAAHGGMAAAVQRLQALPYYPELFTLAFGDGAVTEDRMQRALAQFLRAMVSTNSRWDEAYARVFDASLPDKGLNLPLPGFTEAENRGRHLFMAPRAAGGQNCAACHQPPTFALAGGSNGLDAGETRRFKSPSLKNVAGSGAFMHDGRFASLEAVVEHYSTGVQDGPALDNRLKGPDGAALRPGLSPDDKAALVAFMRTLSDPVLARDPKFTTPFRADAARQP